MQLVIYFFLYLGLILLFLFRDILEIKIFLNKFIGFQDLEIGDVEFRKNISFI